MWLNEEEGVLNFNENKEIEQDQDLSLNIYLLTSPTQSGKTQETFELITNHMNEDKSSIHFVFTDNITTLKEQTYQRYKQQYGIDNIFSIGYETKNNNYTNTFQMIRENLNNRIQKYEIKHICIFSCFNETRFNELDEIIKEEHIMNEYVDIHIYIDESDKACSPNNKYFDYFIENKKQYKTITFITATDKSYASFINNNIIDVLPINDIKKFDNYYCLKNHRFTEITYKLSIEDIIDIVNTNQGHKLIFYDHKTNSQKELLHKLIENNKKNSIYIIDNQNGRKIFINKEIYTNFDNKRESYQQIIKRLLDIYINYEVIIIGYNCLGRGISYHYCNDKSEFYLSYIILNKDNVNACQSYQMLSRANSLIPKQSEHPANILTFKSNWDNAISYERYKLFQIADNNNIKNTYKNIEEEDKKHYDSRMRVPIVYNDEEFVKEFITEFENYPGKYKREKLNKIKNFIKNQNDDKVYDFCNNHRNKQITIPKTEKSRKKHIINAIQKYEKNEPFSIALSKEWKNENNWQVFIDKHNYNIIVIIWSLDENKY